MKLVVGSVLVLFAGVSFAAQESRSFLDAATVVIDADAPPFRRLADLDRDGDLDGVGVQVSRDAAYYRFYAYKNDGQGAFERSWSTARAIGTIGGNDLQVQIGNLNGDAWPDVCVLQRGDRHDWFGETGASFRTVPVVTSYGALAHGLALADLDRDGRDDVVWVDNYRLFVDTGSADADVSCTGLKHGLRVFPGDGPAGSDLFLVAADDDVRLFYGGPAIGLVAGPVFTHDLPMPMLDAGDVDGDGDVDAVVFGGGHPAEFRVLRRDAPGAWSLESETQGGPAEFLLDVDGDGDLDGACCGGGGGGGGPEYQANLQPTDFQISINDGTGRFADAFPIAGLGSPQLAGVADVDGDGDADLVAGRCVYFADGSIRPVRTASAPPPVRGRRDLSDCDGDGDWDVGYSVELVHSNDGSGNLIAAATTVVPPPAGARYRGAGFPGDFDGDADVDLLVEVSSASRSAVPAPGAPGHSQNPLALMALLRNDGTGALTQAALASDPGVTFAVDGREAEDSLVLDPDQDGDLDLFTHTQELSGATRMWANDGTGRFRTGGSFPERAVWAGDVDLDGDLDLITNGGDYGGASSRMLLYLGENAVPGRLPDLVQDTRTGGWPIDTAISVGDFNLDAYPDFALITPGSYYEVLAFNNVFPTGSTLVANVTLASSYPLGEDQRVDLGDLDGDGLIDALVGPHDGELTDISELYHKRGPTYATYGAFDPFVQQLAPAGLLVDLDTDGDLDVLGSRIVFNRTVP